MPTADETFLASRLADPFLRGRDIAETIAMIVHARMSGCAPALEALLADGGRPLALRRQAAAALAALGVGHGVAAADPDTRELAALARGDRTPLAAWIADPGGHDADVASWIAVACLLSATEALPGLLAVLRDEARTFDVRRNAADAWRWP